MKNVLILNGGRGAGTLINEIIIDPSLYLTSVVNAYDDGKSTGEIRRFFSMLGPSDIRKVQSLMLKQDDIQYQDYKKLFDFRFPNSIENSDALKYLNDFISNKDSSLPELNIADKQLRSQLQKITSTFLDALHLIEKSSQQEFNFKDCSLMNCLYAGAFIYEERNIEEAAKFFKEIFNLKGNVLPNSIENKCLMAIRQNGEVLYSEAEIVELRSNVLIDRIYLVDNYFDHIAFERLTSREKKEYLEIHNSYVHITQEVSDAILSADIIIYAPGTQHSSLYPTYMTKGLSRTISNNKSAKKVFITNIGADYETPTYKASDYILGAYKYLTCNDKDIAINDLFDVNLVNQSDLKNPLSYVENDTEALNSTKIDTIIDIYESKNSPGKHDGKKLLETILNL